MARPKFVRLKFIQWKYMLIVVEAKQNSKDSTRGHAHDQQTFPARPQWAVLFNTEKPK